MMTPTRMTPSASSNAGYWKALFLAVLSATALACITINVYFPEAAVRDLSEKIEAAVAEEAAKATSSSSTTDSSASPSSTLRFAVPVERAIGERIRAEILPRLLSATASQVHAQDVASPEISNPAIREIIESRGQRLPELQPFKASGVLGENLDALLEARDLSALALKDRARIQKLIKSENADRERMFKEIAAATGTDLSQLPQIRETYAATLRAHSLKGEWIQMPDGSWKQK